MKYELDPYHQNTPNQELLDDLKRVASELRKDKVTGDEYAVKGKFAVTTIARRFGTWNSALEKAGLNATVYQNKSSKELLDDLKKVAAELGKDSITQNEYTDKGKFGITTITARFGSWNKALQRAGLELTLNLNISEKELFENIEAVWISLGRQPKRNEMLRPISKYSERPYYNKFGTWRKALEAFVEFINSDNNQIQETEELERQTTTPELSGNEPVFKHKTKRFPNERLKVQVLMRDGNKCRLCGITLTGENIHFDHIKPWSKGGETVLENLQILCAQHNHAKGNII